MKPRLSESSYSYLPSLVLFYKRIRFQKQERLKLRAVEVDNQSSRICIYILIDYKECYNDNYKQEIEFESNSTE